MKQRGTSALCLLVIICWAFVPGEILSSSPPLNLTVPSTSSPPHSFLTTASESLTHLNAFTDDSSAALELSGKSTLNQRHNASADITQASATTASTGTTANSSLLVNNTSVPGNLIDSQSEIKPSAGNSQTLSPPSPPTISTLSTMPAPTASPETNTSGSIKTTKTSAATTTMEIQNPATSSVVTTPRSSSTASPKGTIAPTITTISTSQTTEQSNLDSSTPFQAKARFDSPSELNVGDDNSSSSMDPLLAGLVSVFVVTAAAISLLIFLKFRNRNEQPEFRRLQDLPMDDIMEDTPLSMYSY